MTALPPVSNVIKTALLFTLNTQQVCNVFHWKKDTGPIVQQDLEDIGEYVKDWWVTLMAANVEESVYLNAVECWDLSAQPGLYHLHTTGLPDNGNVTGNQIMPGNVTVAVKWSTGYAGRSYRGRTYHVGLYTTAVNGNRVVLAYADNILTVYRSLFEDAPGGFHMGVVSYYHDKALRTTPVFTQITACTINTALDSQRRRLTERGQ